jgi:hypothetical protein
VKQHLDDGNLFIYNNGDPLLFNNFANAFARSMIVLQRRGLLRRDHEIARSIALRPIAMIADSQSALCDEGKRLIGGRVHDLVIFPDGTMKSDSGVVSRTWS